jgi:hypothetical protein
MARAVFVIGLAIALSACKSPEAARTRGGGPGADVGNRGDQVELHGKVDPYHQTPKKGAGH